MKIRLSEVNLSQCNAVSMKLSYNGYVISFRFYLSLNKAFSSPNLTLDASKFPPKFDGYIQVNKFNQEAQHARCVASFRASVLSFSRLQLDLYSSILFIHLKLSEQVSEWVNKAAKLTLEILFSVDICLCCFSSSSLFAYKSLAPRPYNIW